MQTDECKEMKMEFICWRIFGWFKLIETDQDVKIWLKSEKGKYLRILLTLLSINVKRSQMAL